MYYNRMHVNCYIRIVESILYNSIVSAIFTWYVLCSRDLDWTLIKVVRWLFSGHFWPFWRQQHFWLGHCLNQNPNHPAKFSLPKSLVRGWQVDVRACETLSEWQTEYLCIWQCERRVLMFFSYPKLFFYKLFLGYVKPFLVHVHTNSVEGSSGIKVLCLIIYKKLNRFIKKNVQMITIKRSCTLLTRG